VWLADERSGNAELVWRTGEGRFRHLGTPPGGAELVEPTLEDGYLLLVGRFDEEVAA
jgi:ABC-2 type transport system ATP-binding protein